MNQRILNTPPPSIYGFEAYLLELAKELGEHCDSVRIFCVLPTEGGRSIGVDAGFGNLYSQHGQVQEWLTIQEQYARNWAIREDAKNE